jgi:hypothetical protein
VGPVGIEPTTRGKLCDPLLEESRRPIYAWDRVCWHLLMRWRVEAFVPAFVPGHRRASDPITRNHARRCPGSRVAGGHRAATRRALDAGRRRADPHASGRRVSSEPGESDETPTAVRVLSDPGAMADLGSVAGALSQRKYDEMLRSWRRRNRKLFAVLALICTAIMGASFVLAQRWTSQAWTLGLMGGAAMAFFVVARISPPAWIENWQVGAWGEQATAKVLRPLQREGWVVLHDLPMGKGNVDHLVVGPGGVYLLDSKRLAGSVTVEAGDVTVRRLDDPDLSYRHPGTPHLMNLARQTHQRVLETSRIRTWVTPVMVLWAEFPQRVTVERCAYVHGDELTNWLRSRPQTIAPGRVEQVAGAVRAAWKTEKSAA